MNMVNYQPPPHIPYNDYYTQTPSYNIPDDQPQESASQNLNSAAQQNNFGINEKHVNANYIQQSDSNQFNNSNDSNKDINGNNDSYPTFRPKNQNQIQNQTSYYYQTQQNYSQVRQNSLSNNTPLLPYHTQPTFDHQNNNYPPRPKIRFPVNSSTLNQYSQSEIPEYYENSDRNGNLDCVSTTGNTDANITNGTYINNNSHDENNNNNNFIMNNNVNNTEYKPADSYKIDEASNFHQPQSKHVATELLTASVNLQPSSTEYSPLPSISSQSMQQHQHQALLPSAASTPPPSHSYFQQQSVPQYYYQNSNIHNSRSLNYNNNYGYINEPSISNKFDHNIYNHSNSNSEISYDNSNVNNMNNIHLVENNVNNIHQNMNINCYNYSNNENVNGNENSNNNRYVINEKSSTPAYDNYRYRMSSNNTYFTQPQMMSNTLSSSMNMPTIDPNHGYKRSYSDYESFDDKKISSIAGVVYNSTAVFKRLKPSSLEDPNDDNFGKSFNRTQGRPFSSNVSCRFILHENLKSLLNHVDKKNSNKFIVYDMRKHKEDYLLENNITNTKTVVKKQQRERITHSNDGYKIQQLLFKNLKQNLDNSTSFRMGMIDENISAEISCEALDNFLGYANEGVLKIDGYREKSSPKQKNISYNPKKDKSKNKNANANASANTNKNCKMFNFHELIKENFEIDEYVFIKTIRDNNGHILKLETIKPPVGSDGNYEYTPEWLKRKICYPRYKGGMNLHLLDSNSNFILYNDLKMLLWDIKEEIMTRDEKNVYEILNANNNNSNTDMINGELKYKLFGDKKIYIRTIEN